MGRTQRPTRGAATEHLTRRMSCPGRRAGRPRPRRDALECLTLTRHPAESPLGVPRVERVEWVDHIVASRLQTIRDVAMARMGTATVIAASATASGPGRALTLSDAGGPHAGGGPCEPFRDRRGVLLHGLLRSMPRVATSRVRAHVQWGEPPCAGASIFVDLMGLLWAQPARASRSRLRSGRSLGRAHCYELWLSPSTVAQHLSLVRLKVVLPSGAALHRVCAAWPTESFNRTSGSCIFVTISAHHRRGQSRSPRE
jgi:hypothetical protein